MKISRINVDGENKFAIYEDAIYKEIENAIGDKKLTGKEYLADNVKLLCPCEPSKVVAVGLNYKMHAKEMGLELPKHPLIFLKPSTSVIGCGDEIVYPDMSKRVDHEAELGIVIGKECKNVSVSEAKDYVLGYTCLNDVSARDLQKTDGQWTRAKGFDTFCPIGPYIDTEFEPRDKSIKAILNGVVKQDSNIDDMIFDVYEIISFISEIMTLKPFDVIATGTPSGIGPMQKGDEIVIEIEGLTKLVNKVQLR